MPEKVCLSHYLRNQLNHGEANLRLPDIALFTWTLWASLVFYFLFLLNVSMDVGLCSAGCDLGS
jgi:hypothetical protein